MKNKIKLQAISQFQHGSTPRDAGSCPTRKLSDTEVVRHGSCPTKPNLTTPEFVGELPCRTNSVSDKFRLPNSSFYYYYYFAQKGAESLRFMELLHRTAVELDKMVSLFRKLLRMLHRNEMIVDGSVPAVGRMEGGAIRAGIGGATSTSADDGRGEGHAVAPDRSLEALHLFLLLLAACTALVFTLVVRFQSHGSHTYFRFMGFAPDIIMRFFNIPSCPRPYQLIVILIFSNLGADLGAIESVIRSSWHHGAMVHGSLAHWLMPASETELSAHVMLFSNLKNNDCFQYIEKKVLTICWFEVRVDAYIALLGKSEYACLMKKSENCVLHLKIRLFLRT